MQKSLFAVPTISFRLLYGLLILHHDRLGCGCGQVVMSMKFGSKPVEFEKGRAGIVVGPKEKLPAVIDTLIAAVRAGELDDLDDLDSGLRYPAPRRPARDRHTR